MPYAAEVLCRLASAVAERKTLRVVEARSVEIKCENKERKCYPLQLTRTYFTLVPRELNTVISLGTTNTVRSALCRDVKNIYATVASEVPFIRV